MNRAERRAQARGKGVILPPAPSKVLTLGYCYSGVFGVAGLWHQSVLKLLAAGSRAGLAFREMPAETGPFLSRSRNHILERHLQYGDDYLLFTDTDTVFSPEDVGLLLEADAAIAGALYFAAAPDGKPPWATALVEDGDMDPDGGGESVSPVYVPIVLPELPVAPLREENHTDEQYTAAVQDFMVELARPEFQPQKVASVGMGLTLIKREVCEAMAMTFENPFEYVGDTGEDITFCHRAASIGFDTILVPQARIGHIKQVII